MGRDDRRTEYREYVDTNQIINLNKEGWWISEISRRLNLSIFRVTRLHKKAGLPRNPYDKTIYYVQGIKTDATPRTHHKKQSKKSTT